MVWAVSLATALISLGGLFLIFIFAIEISGHGNSHTSSIVFLIIALLVLLVIVALMIRLLSRLVNAHLQSRGTAQPAPTPLSEQPTAQLPEARESVPVSDEQTTRRFEPAPGERK